MRPLPSPRSGAASRRGSTSSRLAATAAAGARNCWAKRSAIGLTTHARPQWIREFVDAHPWDCVVLKEHVLYSRNQEVIDHLAARGTGVVIMTPLAGGVVATPGPEIREALRRAGCTPAVLGLRYLVSNPGVSSAISGMTTPGEVDDNVRAGDLDGPLTDTEQRLIATIRQRTSALGALLHKLRLLRAVSAGGQYPGHLPALEPDARVQQAPVPEGPRATALGGHPRQVRRAVRRGRPGRRG